MNGILTVLKRTQILSKMRTKVFIIICIAASFCLFGCKDRDKESAIKSIGLRSSLNALEIGEIVELGATVMPVNATDELLWFTRDAGVATVEALSGSNGRNHG